jgi:hypothetical protein
LEWLISRGIKDISLALRSGYIRGIGAPGEGGPSVDAEALRDAPLLVENAGRLMLKEEILERIWPDQYTGEANLANNIHAIRRLIEDDLANRN